MGLLILCWNLIDPQNAFIFGALTYLILSFSLKTLIPKEHKKGIKNVKSGNFEEAILHFEKSYDFFNQFKWIDKFRYFVLLSSSRMSYKEMALTNIAFCYGQIGNGKKAKEYYERTLDEFPDSGLALSGLRLLNSMLNGKE